MYIYIYRERENDDDDDDDIMNCRYKEGSKVGRLCIYVYISNLKYTWSQELQYISTTYILLIVSSLACSYFSYK